MWMDAVCGTGCLCRGISEEYVSEDACCKSVGTASDNVGGSISVER